MVRMSKSFSVWCFKYHKDIYSLLMFGHTELLTEDMYKEYLGWLHTDEGKQSLQDNHAHRVCG